jgi:hypothetical protein
MCGDCGVGVIDAGDELFGAELPTLEDGGRSEGSPLRTAEARSEMERS